MYNTLRETTFCVWRHVIFFRSFTNVRLLCFVSHSNGMTSCQSSSTENVSRNVAPFFYHHSVVIQHLLSNDKKFCFSLIGLNSIFSTLPQSEYTSRAVNIPRVQQWVYLACSEYTSRAVSTPRVRYIRACFYFCLLSIRCFNVVQAETRFHF